MKICNQPSGVLPALGLPSPKERSVHPFPETSGPPLRDPGVAAAATAPLGSLQSTHRPRRLSRLAGGMCVHPPPAGRVSRRGSVARVRARGPAPEVCGCHVISRSRELARVRGGAGAGGAGLRRRRRCRGAAGGALGAGGARKPVASRGPSGSLGSGRQARRREAACRWRG